MVVLYHAAAFIGSALALIQGTQAQCGCNNTAPSVPEYNHTAPSVPEYNHTAPSVPGYSHTAPSVPGYSHTAPYVPELNNTKQSTSKPGDTDVFIPGYNYTGVKQVPRPPQANESFDSIFRGVTPAEETPGQPGKNVTNGTVTDSIFPDVNPRPGSPQGPPWQNITNGTMTESMFPGEKPRPGSPHGPPWQNITNGTMTESIFPPLRNITRPPPLPVPKGLFTPSTDSWYRAPPEYAVAIPGDFLKIREAPGILASVLKNLKQSDQIMYRTSDTFLNPAWAVATVLAPKAWDTSRPRVVSLQVPYETVNVDFSPSYLLSTASPEIRYNILDQMLANGWHVIIPDYQGPKSAFGAGRMAGYSVLDALRVIRAIGNGRYGLNPGDSRYAAWGYSGGGLATAFAFLRKKKYTNDAKTEMVDTLSHRLTTFAIGGMPVKLLDTIEAVNTQVRAGVAFNAIAGLMLEYPRMKEAVEQFGKTEGAHNISVFDRIRTMSPGEVMYEFEYANLDDYFEGGLKNLTTRLRKKKFDRAIRVSDPEVPWTDGERDNLFVYHGVYDKMNPIVLVDRVLHKFWCNWRAGINYVRNHDGGHDENEDNAKDAVLDWIANKFIAEFVWHIHQKEKPKNGAPPFEGCLALDADYKAPIWDFDAYMKTLNAGEESNTGN